MHETCVHKDRKQTARETQPTFSAWLKLSTSEIHCVDVLVNLAVEGPDGYDATTTGPPWWPGAPHPLRRTERALQHLDFRLELLLRVEHFEDAAARAQHPPW